LGTLPYYLGSFNSNYIIFRNVEKKIVEFFLIPEKSNFCEGKY
jgi:hypothetical protein